MLCDGHSLPDVLDKKKLLAPLEFTQNGTVRIKSLFLTVVADEMGRRKAGSVSVLKTGVAVGESSRHLQKYQLSALWPGLGLERSVIQNPCLTGVVVLKYFCGKHDKNLSVLLSDLG